MRQFRNGERMFRLWIASYADWRPVRWSDLPPRAMAIEPVEETTYSADEAALFLEGFNSAMLASQRPIWAVAVPIVIRFDGDAVAGAAVRGFDLAGAATMSGAPPRS